VAEKKTVSSPVESPRSGIKTLGDLRAVGKGPPGLAVLVQFCVAQSEKTAPENGDEGDGIFRFRKGFQPVGEETEFIGMGEGTPPRHAAVDTEFPEAVGISGEIATLPGDDQKILRAGWSP
jgi:hypothetical protein